MDMWSFARRPFIGEEKIAEAALAKDDRHVDLFTPRLTVDGVDYRFSEHYT